MPHSVDRFLTTHTGSLPRPHDLIQMMYAKEEGKPVARDRTSAANSTTPDFSPGYHTLM